MKHLSVIAALACALLLSACAAEEPRYAAPGGHAYPYYGYPYDDGYYYGPGGYWPWWYYDPDHDGQTPPSGGGGGSGGGHPPHRGDHTPHPAHQRGTASHPAPHAAPHVAPSSPQRPRTMKP